MYINGLQITSNAIAVPTHGRRRRRVILAQNDVGGTRSGMHMCLWAATISTMSLSTLKEIASGIWNTDVYSAHRHMCIPADLAIVLTLIDNGLQITSNAIAVPTHAKSPASAKIPAVTLAVPSLMARDATTLR
jgi:hypothetical protein